MRISDWSSDVCSSDLEYYQLSLEKTLLAIAGHDLQSFSIDTICELGAGSALKASMLIKAMNASGRTLRYCPIDVNERVMSDAGAKLAAQFPFLSTEALVGTYEQGLTSLAAAPVRQRTGKGQWRGDRGS